MAPRKRASQTSPSSQKKAPTRAAAGAQFTCCTSTKRYKYTVTPHAAPRQIRRTTRPHLTQFTRFTSTKKFVHLLYEYKKVRMLTPRAAPSRIRRTPLLPMLPRQMFQMPTPLARATAFAMKHQRGVPPSSHLHKTHPQPLPPTLLT